MDRVGLVWAMLIVVVLSFVAGGCVTVKPWERSGLADPVMRTDRDPLTDAYAEHIFFSREGAAGGRDVGGGGCGCN